MDLETISALVRERLLETIPHPIERDEVIRHLPEPAPFNLVHIITGMRRCGKTFYLFQLMQHLLAAGVSREQMFYFDFSDVRLLPFAPGAMDVVLDEYWRQVPRARTEGAYLFLDEVQEVDEWQRVCQRLAEHERVTLVITGSSSKVSSDEIATQFRGRSHVHEMLPLSFAEFCRFHDIGSLQAGQRAFSPEERTRYESAFDDYLIWGGFPGIQHQASEDRIELLQGYVRDVVARDVAERSGKEDIALAMQLALFAIRNTACELSTNELVKRLGDAGRSTYWKKVDQLLGLLKQAYLVHELSEYSTLLLQDGSAERKVYAEDPGLVYAVSRASQQDVGKRLETAVYLELRRRNAGRRTDTVTSYTSRSSRREKIDFLVGDALGAEPYELYQVTAEMHAPKTRAREFGSLEVAMRETGLKEGVILTLREHGQEERGAGSIRVLPAWRWMLARE